MSRARIPFPLLPAWLRWGAVVVVATVIFYGSVLTNPPGTPLETVKPALIPLDKWYHLLGYAGFGGALAYATADWATDWRALAVGVIALTVAYGIGIEVVQSVLPARDFSIGDAYANALGAVVVLPWYALRSRLALVSVSEFVSE